MRTAIDLFAGAGGATQGLKDAGFEVVAAVENDKHAAASFELNHSGVVLFGSDIRTIEAYRLRRILGLRRGELDLLKACPPCQGFSSLARGDVDELRNDLVLDTYRFAREFLPRTLLLENVPGLGADQRLTSLLRLLDTLGYRSEKYRVNAQDFGVPQRRRRLIVLAVRDDVAGPLPEDVITALPDDFDRSVTSAGDALDELARTNGRSDDIDPLNIFRRSRADVVARLAAIPVGGSRFDLPAEYQLACHVKLTKDGVTRRVATASYGRVRADAPAPTMTTRCTTPACGSFVHPTLHRGLTLREAATFQTFPHRYLFAGGYDSVERQIGNAVPVKMATGLGRIVIDLLRP